MFSYSVGGYVINDLGISGKVIILYPLHVLRELLQFSCCMCGALVLELTTAGYIQGDFVPENRGLRVVKGAYRVICGVTFHWE